MKPARHLRAEVMSVQISERRIGSFPMNQGAELPKNGNGNGDHLTSTVGRKGIAIVRAQILKYWDRIRSSFWFLPSLMAVGAAVLAFASVAGDDVMMNRWFEDRGWAYSGGAQGASELLGTIAGSMITIAGVVFSMTLVALSLASSQFGPRLLRNFMRDTANQIVLGTFIATFLYCLLVLRSIRYGEENAFVPHLSVTMGVLLALASLGVLIYYVHHVSLLIQADEIIARVGVELNEGLDLLFPEQIGQGASPAAIEWSCCALPDEFEREARAVRAPEDGYLQLVDADALMRLATEEDAIFRVEYRPGHYIVRGSALARVWPAARLTDNLASRIAAAFAQGVQRSAAQDIEFPIGQLVEIAVRALSPGVNDPFTAITCVDRLGAGLCRLAQRELPVPYRLDGQNQLRVVAPPITFSGILDAAFNQIRQNARSSAPLSIRLLETIAVVAQFTVRPEDRSALRHHADMILRGARDGLPENEDRRAVEDRFLKARRLLHGPERPDS